MDFRISDTFTDSLAKLTGDEQKAVKMTAFDLQLNPAHPSMSLHRIEKSKDKYFWSVRAGSDIRLIVHKTAASLLLCYVDHHDKAYRWAERRKLETHPKTGAAQWVEIRERVEELPSDRPRFTAEPVATDLTTPAAPKPALFAQLSDDELLGYGVPPDWLADVRAVTEDGLLELADHLPSEAAEALLELATGGTPVAFKAAAAGTDPFNHPDAQRRFRVMNDVDELERAFAYPWEKWTTFLHPAQRQWVERDYNGPARVSGSAGTGKTIVALHRAVHLAQTQPDSRVLLTTFSDTLAHALTTKLKRLISNKPRLGDRLEVHAMAAIGQRLFDLHLGRSKVATRDQIRTLMTEAAKQVPGLKFNLRFLLGEWDDLVDAWQLNSWDAYREVKRLGRKTRLSEAQRTVLWSIFENVQTGLRDQGLITQAEMFTRLAEKVAVLKHPPFDFVVVDEAQDISVAQLRFLAAIGASQGVILPSKTVLLS
jgi:mRNA-degrading endonuclease RelE of RelBE toxin-antitoxin system